MVNLIFVHSKNDSIHSYSKSNLKKIARRITPDNAPFDPLLVREPDTLFCLTDESQPVPVENKSVCLGVMTPPTEDWHEPNTRRPDGTYAIIRADEDTIELISDHTASRSMFYRLFDDLFVASTSQRAIMHFSESFKPDRESFLWMLSSGNLGPKHTWDERINHLPPNSIVRLKRDKWRLEIERNPKSLSYNPTRQSKEQIKKRLEKTLNKTISNMEIDYSKWVLPLSGGLDSRALLHLLRDKKEELKTITWGTSQALNEEDNDAYLAKQLAEEYGFDHKYYELPQVPKNIGNFFERYLTAGEGRIDHIDGYIDEFKVFENLSNNDYVGMIRGDHGFGYDALTPFTNVPRLIGAGTLKDVTLLSDSLSNFSLIPWAEKQRLPDTLKRNENETREDWRDRLRLSYRVPYVLGSLSSLKSPYVEIVNPFLSQNVLSVAKSLPIKARNDKSVWKDFVLSKDSGIPIARQSATPSRENILAHPKMSEYLKKEIHDEHTRKILDENIVDYTLKRLESSKDDSSNSSIWKMMGVDFREEMAERIPSSVLRALIEKTTIDFPQVRISPNKLALRMFLIKSMVKKLRADVDIID